MAVPVVQLGQGSIGGTVQVSLPENLRPSEVISWTAWVKHGAYCLQTRPASERLHDPHEMVS